jgi:ABC-2 type transport system ATP-binding protein
MPRRQLLKLDVFAGHLRKGAETLENAVETFDLAKSYGKQVALSELNFKIRSGEIMVVLGPNGSGKTTLLHLLSTVLRPTKGTARVMGYDIVKQPLQVREVVGVAFQEPRGFWRHKPTHILSFHASIYGYEGERKRKAVEEVLKEFELWDSRDKRFMELSGGQGKRLEVAKLFIQKPKVAILDEPSSMVDLTGKRLIWDKIRELREMGSTCIVATNEVREGEYLADRITIMSKGKHVVTDTLSTLKDSIRGGDIVELEFTAPADDSIVTELQQVGGTARVLRETDSSLRAYVSKSEDWLPIVMERLHSLGAKVASVRVTEPSLDDVFLKYTGGSLSEDVSP